MTERNDKRKRNQLLVRLDDEERRMVAEMAAREGLTLSAMVRRLIREGAKWTTR